MPYLHLTGECFHRLWWRGERPISVDLWRTKQWRNGWKKYLRSRSPTKIHRQPMTCCWSHRRFQLAVSPWKKMRNKSLWARHICRGFSVLQKLMKSIHDGPWEPVRKMESRAGLKLVAEMDLGTWDLWNFSSLSCVFWHWVVWVWSLKHALHQQPLHERKACRHRFRHGCPDLFWFHPETGLERLISCTNLWNFAWKKLTESYWIICHSSVALPRGGWLPVLYPAKKASFPWSCLARRVSFRSPAVTGNIWIGEISAPGKLWFYWNCWRAMW